MKRNERIEVGREVWQEGMGGMRGALRMKDEREE